MSAKQPVMAKIQSNGSVFCYDENGNYVCGQGASMGEAISAQISGKNLIIQTKSGKTLVYEINNGSCNYKSSR